MSLVIKETSKNFTPVPAGTHLAVCVLVADMGLQNDSKYKPRHKLYVRWELIGQTVAWHDKEGREHSGPMMIGKSYTKSLAPKSNLRADLENWRGKMFTEAELREFDVTSILGKACTLGVVHHEVGEKTYADVTAVMGAPKDATAKSVSQHVAFDVDAWDEDMFALLPGWLQQKINDRVVTSSAQQAAPASATAATPDFDDSIPF